MLSSASKPLIIAGGGVHYSDAVATLTDFAEPEEQWLEKCVAQPETGDEHASAARDLVNAMDGLVWAVNPANDTLDHLATHVSAVAQEIFRDSPVRLRRRWTVR